MDKRLEERQKAFASNQTDGGRRQREDQQVQIRKANREEVLAKRRQLATDQAESESGTSGQPTEGLTVEQLPLLAHNLQSSDFGEVYNACHGIRRLLSRKRPPIDAVLQQQGLLAKLIQFTGDSSQTVLQFEAAWAITNICSGTSDQTRVVISSGAIPVLLQQLHSPAVDVMQQVVWALGNIAGDGPEFREVLFNCEIVTHILSLFQPNQNADIMALATWVVSNLCRQDTSKQCNLPRVEPLIRLLVSVLDSENNTPMISDACWGLSYNVAGGDTAIDYVIQMGAVPKLINHAKTSNVCQVITPALRTLGMIVGSNATHTQVVIDNGGVGVFAHLLQNPRLSVRREAAWAISNVAAGNHAQIDAVLDAGLIPVLLTILRDGSFEVQKEAAWGICNCISGGNERQILTLTRGGCLDYLPRFLDINERRLVRQTLQAIKAVVQVGINTSTGEVGGCATWLEVSGTREKLEGLQFESKDPVITSRAASIIKSCYNGDAVIDESDVNKLSEVSDVNQLSEVSGSNQPPPGGFLFTQ
eukprot:GHVN01104758.1.p1 GENE.GHVN01104758.1~~GHVN01104758.1.p1  ORF type:complete len:532 (+),score=107.24 GHVN01104758.1:88-1683(+)